MTLQEFFTQHPKTALAFSGGVDSAYLLYAAKRAGAQVHAYYVRTAFQPEFEYRDACRLARSLDAEMTVLHLDILRDAQVTDNPPNRCYYCKTRIFTAIWQAAAADGFEVLLDGTNASDPESDRPGMQALRELQVLSPLRMCGLTKPEIRRQSRQAGLFTWDKPAYACLATRIPAGTAITAQALERTEWAEEALSRMGFADFRVRTVGQAAVLQLQQTQLALFTERRAEILELLSTRYPRVFLDLQTR